MATMTKPITPQQRAELVALEKGATPGPWDTVVHSTENGTVRNRYTVSKAKGRPGDAPVADCEFVMGWPAPMLDRAANAKLIAAARNAILGYEAALKLAMDALQEIASYGGGPGSEAVEALRKLKGAE